jgi:hypothetical protein
MKIITMHSNKDMDKFDAFLRKQMEGMPSSLPNANKVMEHMNFPTAPATNVKGFSFKKWGFGFLGLAILGALIYFWQFNNSKDEVVVINKSSTTENSTNKKIESAPNSNAILNNNASANNEVADNKNNALIIDDINSSARSTPNNNSTINNSVINPTDDATITQKASQVSGNSNNASSTKNSLADAINQNEANAKNLKNKENVERGKIAPLNINKKADSATISNLKKINTPKQDTINIVW